MSRFQTGEAVRCHVKHERTKVLGTVASIVPGKRRPYCVQTAGGQLWAAARDLVANGPVWVK